MLICMGKVIKEMISIQRNFSGGLLGKWIWRIANAENSLWFEVLDFRYGLSNSGIIDIVSNRPANSNSIWWRDLCSIDDVRQAPSSWLKDGLYKKVDNKSRPQTEIYQALLYVN